MNCPNCGVYNPEDRTVCWRCDKELPKPKPKKKSAFQSSQTWLYIIIAVFFVITILQTCGVRLPFGPQTQQQKPSGYLTPSSPSAHLIELSWKG